MVLSLRHLLSKILGMGRKRKNESAEPMPVTEAKSKTQDRHKPGSRRSIHLPPALYDLLKQLAEKHRRPINWEARIMAEEYVHKHGLQSPADEPE